jgi:hypothetical protein
MYIELMLSIMGITWAKIGIIVLSEYGDKDMDGEKPKFTLSNREFPG